MASMVNKKVSGLSGDGAVIYADVKCEGKTKRILWKIFEIQDAMIQPSFLNFKNADKNYPNVLAQNDIPGMSYRSGPQKWIDNTMMQLWMGKTCTSTKLPPGEKTYCSWTTMLLKRFSKQ